MDEPQIKNVRDWISFFYNEHGKEWIAQNKDQCDTYFRRRILESTYNRALRTIIAWDRQKTEADETVSIDSFPTTDPLTPDRVTTQDDHLQFHRIDLTGLELERATYETWGSEANPNRLVKGVYVPRKGSLGLDQLATLFREMAGESPTYPKIEYPEVETGNILELSIPDLHYGNAVYSTKMAEEMFLESVAVLIDSAQTYRPERILFPVGGDLFNSSNQKNTTAHGTQMQEAAVWHETITTGYKMLVRAIDYARTFAPIHIIGIRGNHDDERAFHLGIYLDAWYRNCPDVTVDAGPDLMKAYQHGRCLIGVAHGHGIPAERFPLKLAQEFPKIWGATKYREVHLGHFHGSTRKSFQEEGEYQGVRVVVVPSLVPRDEWTEGHGYRSIREAQAFVWNLTRGRIAVHHHHPDRAAD